MYRQAIAHTYHLYRIELTAFFITAIGLLMLLLSLILAPAVNAISIGGPSDCDNNAIIHCGVHSTAALKNAYNSSAYVRGVYAEFGITQADIAHLDSTNIAGRVTKGGDVFVDGKSNPVATSAMTGGRQNISGSTKVNHGGAVFYKRPPSVSFQQESLPAFVSMSNGRFQFAVIASCGNAVSATPVAPVKHHVAVAPAKPVSKHHKQVVHTAAAPSQTQEVNVNNSNTNVNNNVNMQEQTQVNKQQTATAQPKSTTEETSTAQPSTQTSAATLPNTGPTGVVGAFLAAVGLGTLGYRRLLLRRLGG